MERLTPDIFLVDDLLNLSNDDEFDKSFTDSPTNSTLADSSNSSSLSHCEPLFSDTSSLSDHLCLPNEELAELEWLSNIVEESFSQEDQDKLQLLSGLKIPQHNNLNRFKPEFEFKHITNITKTTDNSTCHEEVTIPAKARSKRSRSAASTWQSRLLAIEYRPRKKSIRENREIAAGERRCMHCATEKTPQWRTGPMGSKTLCNACGVRYKSGRLVPEYRPAASPTFELSRHSNSHRKVVELRRQKERQEDYLVMSKVDGEDVLMEIRSNGEDYLISNNVNNHFKHF